MVHNSIVAVDFGHGLDFAWILMTSTHTKLAHGSLWTLGYLIYGVIPKLDVDVEIFAQLE
jgi:hypothetical protein